MRNELIILQHAVQKAIDNGWQPRSGSKVMGVDFVHDPPSICISFNEPGNDPLYFDLLFPLFEREWALAFWGKQPTGNGYFGLLSAWKYHQHRLLEFVQNGEMEEFYKYIEIYL